MTAYERIHAVVPLRSHQIFEGNELPKEGPFCIRDASDEWLKGWFWAMSSLYEIEVLPWKDSELGSENDFVLLKTRKRVTQSPHLSSD